MEYEKRLLERYRSALRERQIAENHFMYCEPAFIDSAVDGLIRAEGALARVLKEIRDGMGTEISGNQE